MGEARLLNILGRVLFFLFKTFLISHLLMASNLGVYWGVVSPGRGQGALGHGFLLFKNSDEPFITGDVYQYNVTIDSEKKIIEQALNLTLKLEKFYLILAEYTLIENRNVTLYELNLSQDEAVHLLDLLKMDLNNPHFG